MFSPFNLCFFLIRPDWILSKKNNYIQRAGCLQTDKSFPTRQDRTGSQRQRSDHISSFLPEHVCRIIWVFLSTGIWVYPLLGLFSAPGLVGFFIFNMSVVTLLYMLGEKLNHRVWSKKLATSKVPYGHSVMSL